VFAGQQVLDDREAGTVAETVEQARCAIQGRTFRDRAVIAP
jgi:hypothetical protein